MTGLFVAMAAALAGWAACTSVNRARLGSPPSRLMRTNVRGRPVPAVLGDGVSMGSVVGAAFVAVMAGLGLEFGPPLRVMAALLVVSLLLWAAGAVDDRRGDEPTRGFKGHLGALRTGAVTGGAVKIAGGVVAGTFAGLLVGTGGWLDVMQVALLVALSANLVNLFDRAPGRALKVAFLASLPVAILAPWWGIAAAGSGGALLAAVGPDLREEGMLGDAGANALGGVFGLGLALATSGAARWWPLAVLALLTVASEIVSFSRLIESQPVLRWFDRLGRETP